MEIRAVQFFKGFFFFFFLRLQITCPAQMVSFDVLVSVDNLQTETQQRMRRTTHYFHTNERIQKSNGRPDEGQRGSILGFFGFICSPA